MNKQLKRHNNLSYKFTARNAAIIFLHYRKGYEEGIDLPEMISDINMHSNISKLHIYLDFLVSDEYDPQLIQEFVNNVFDYCEKYAAINIKIAIHASALQIMRNCSRNNAFQSVIDVVEMFERVSNAHLRDILVNIDTIETYKFQHNKCTSIGYLPFLDSNNEANQIQKLCIYNGNNLGILKQFVDYDNYFSFEVKVIDMDQFGKRVSYRKNYRGDNFGKRSHV